MKQLQSINYMFKIMPRSLILVNPNIKERIGFVLSL